MALSARDVEVYSNEVLNAYVRSAKRYGRRMAGVSVADFIKHTGMANASSRIYRNVALHVELADELDVRDETVGHYEFSYDATSPDWYAQLVADIASVLELKTDYALSYGGTDLSAQDGMAILLDERRGRATLRLGSPDAAPLVVAASVKTASGAAKRASGKRRASASAPTKMFAERHLQRVYNRAATATARQFAALVERTPPQQWPQLVAEEDGLRRIAAMFAEQLRSEKIYGRYANERLTPTRTDPRMFGASDDSAAAAAPAGGDGESVVLSPALRDFWRSAGLKNVATSLGAIAGEFATLLARSLAEHAREHGVLAHAPGALAPALSARMRMSEASGDNYGAEMQKFIDARRHALDSAAGSTPAAAATDSLSQSISASVGTQSDDEDDEEGDGGDGGAVVKGKCRERIYALCAPSWHRGPLHAADTRATGKKRKSAMYRSGHSAPALVPVGTEAAHPTLRGRAGVPRLEPITFAAAAPYDAAAATEAAADESSYDMLENAMLHEITPAEAQGRVLTYADRMAATAVVEFADDDDDDDDDDDGDAPVLSASGTSAYTAEQLQLLKHMPALEPLAQGGGAASATRPIATDMPRLVPITHESAEQVRFVEAQVSNFSAPGRVACGGRGGGGKDGDDGGDDDDDDDDQTQQSLTESMVATQGMNFTELMQYKLERQKAAQAAAAASTAAAAAAAATSAAAPAAGRNGMLVAVPAVDIFGASVAIGDDDEEGDDDDDAARIVYSSSSGDTENFARDFARYVRLHGDAVAQGAVVLAPVSSVYTEKASKGVMAMDDKTFSAFMELHIMKPAAATGGAPGLRFSKATKKAKFVPMRGVAMELVRDAERQVWSVDAHNKKHKIVAPHTYADYPKVYFVGNAFLLQPQ